MYQYSVASLTWIKFLAQIKCVWVCVILRGWRKGSSSCIVSAAAVPQQQSPFVLALTYSLLVDVFYNVCVCVRVCVCVCVCVRVCVLNSDLTISPSFSACILLK